MVMNSARQRRGRWWMLTLAVSLLSVAQGAGAADIPVYTDTLSPEWQNWSWSSTPNFSNQAPVHAGTQSLAVTYTAAWAGLYLHPTAGYATSQYDRLTFWLHGGSVGNQRLRIVANGDTAHTYPVTALANTWMQVTVPFSALGSPATLSELYWQDVTGAAQPVFYLDDIQLLASNAPPPTLSIDGGAGRHAISDAIYGMNYAAEALAAELHLPVRRWGGNSTTRYNWRTSMTNTASDWYFENLPEGTVNVATLPSGSASDQFVEQNRRTGTQSLLTVPLIGWTAKASSPRSHPYACAFKVSQYGAQQSIDPWDTNCGNGVKQDGSHILGNAPQETSDAIDPAFVQGWVTHLIGKYGTAANQGVAFYALDNEPMLWNSTHRDIHPLPVSYDELRDRTYQYAAAVKAADPSAKTLGPVLWGWCAYLYSARDGCSPGIDYQTHGQQLFVPWYLSQMRAYEQAHQQRILDYLDLHYYPQANGVSLSTAGSAATQALRLRSTRSLWDATYTDESWIADTAAGGVQVQLIPRMRDWVNTFYPGTRLALTEYNWGGLESLNGALAQADVLGIFGRENLELATLWSPPTTSQPGAFAFRMYRNYDGLGQGFGDQSVAALSSNQAALAIYAAQRSRDHALTMLVINKTATALTSPVTITGLSLPTTAAVYRYSAANLNAIVRVADQPLTRSGFSALYPANSITLVVMTPGSGAGTVALTVNKTGTGQGNVTPSSGTLTWTGTTGTGAYGKGTAVTLSAIAATGSTFSHWTGCDSVNANTCTVSMTAAKSVTVTFTLNQYLLTANAAGSGAGSMAANVGGLSFTYPASKTGSVKINHGATVTLTATGTNGSTVAWSGTSGCDTVTGTTSSAICTINSMTAARTATATFTAPCTFNLSPTTKTFTKTGGNGSAKITASASTCAWTAKSNVTWATLSKTSFTGSATVNYAVAKNTSGSKRTGTLTLAGKTFTITQTK